MRCAQEWFLFPIHAKRKCWSTQICRINAGIYCFNSCTTTYATFWSLSREPVMKSQSVYTGKYRVRYNKSNADRAWRSGLKVTWREYVISSAELKIDWKGISVSMKESVTQLQINWRRKTTYILTKYDSFFCKTWVIEVIWAIEILI